MLKSTERYKGYQPIQGEWYKEVPSHWEEFRFKDFAQILSGYAPEEASPEFEGDYCYYKVDDLNSVSSDYIIAQSTWRTGLRKRVYDFEILLLPKRGMSIFLNKIAISGEACVFDTNLMGLRIDEAKACLKFIIYFISSAKLSRIADTTATPQLNNKHIYPLRIYLPKLPEQEIIANYLDTQTARIDQKIDLLRKKAEKYADLKQALINETVTRGLDKSVPMKDSDVEWIGEVPEHWDIRRIKDVCSINDQTIGANENPQREILYVDISSVNFLHGITSKEPLTLADAPSRARRVVKDGDVIVSTVRTYLRAIANIENPEPNLIVSTGFAVLRPKGLLASYAGYAFRTSFFIERIVWESTGVSYPAINSSEIASFDIPTPPEDEQQLITKYLDKKCSEIDAICSALNKQVNALTELRKTLINDVVTGKIKVA